MSARPWIPAALLVMLASAAAVTPGQSQTPAQLEKIKQAINAAKRKPPTPATPAPTTGAAAAGAAAQAPLNAKVDEALMGPRTQRVHLSEDGEHIAIVAPKGSREIVLIDGVEGPVFDEIPLNFSWTTYRESGGSIVFSPTGGHSAYVGRRAGDFIAVIDGKEAMTLSTPATLQGVTYSDPTGWKFWYSQDGSHLAYAGLAGPASWVMVFDGVKSPGYRAFDFRQTALRGKRLVYVAQTADQQWHAVADGKVGPGFAMISSLQLTPDGAHYAYVANRSGVGAQMASVVVDGVESPRYLSVSDLEQAADGRVAFLAATKAGDPGAHGGGAGALFVGGQELSGSCGAGQSPLCLSFGNIIRSGQGSPQRHVAWSPDGKRFAYIQPNTPNPGATVMVNGKAMGLSYQVVNELRWSPDGSRLVYVGTSPTGNFLVVDGQELGEYGALTEFQFSPDGKRYAFMGYGSKGFALVVDGKEQPKASDLSKGAMQFSPDSKHFVYGAQSSVIAYQPVVDGVAKPYNLQNFFTRNNPPLTFPVFLYSPDGNHLAFTAITLDGTSRGSVIVDGTAYQGPTASFTYPAWSPDSKHFAAVVTTGKGWTVMIDGKLSPLYEDILSPNLAACRFVDGHTYRLYAIKAGQIYRIRLDLGA